MIADGCAHQAWAQQSPETMKSSAELYLDLVRIRYFEEHVLDEFPRGLFFGTTHTYIGQEANGVGVMTALQSGDVVVSNHRCHGHFLAYGGPMDGLAAELMGRSSGVCSGRGGSQHVQWRNFYANGILGGTVPLAVGMALAEKRKRSNAIVIAFLGDGALGQGVVYESLNMAALWSLPVLFVLENNRYAQSTPVDLNLAGGIAGRFEAFGIEADELDSTDVEEIAGIGSQAANSVRIDCQPRGLVLDTYRFGPHSKGDDTRDPNEIARYRERDPIPLQRPRLSEDRALEIEQQARDEVAHAFEQAQAAPLADPADLGLVLGERS